MTPKGDALDESTYIINEIENDLEATLRKRRAQIEHELEERLRREREESERKMSEIEQEFRKEQGTVREYKTVVTEFESARDSLEGQIREHLDKIAQYQKDIEGLTASTLEEIRTVQELSLTLADLRNATETKVNELKAKLKGHFTAAPQTGAEPGPESAPEGVASAEPSAEPPAEGEFSAAPPAENGEVVVNLEQELGKLKRIKELLEKDSIARNGAPAGPVHEANTVPEPVAEPTAPPEAGEGEWSAAEPAGDAAPHADFKMPEINQFIQDFVNREIGQPEGAPAEAKSEERKPAVEEATFQTAFEILEKYRRSETTDYGGEISYFQNRELMILDGESLLRAVGHVVDEAKKLYAKLGQAATPKDQFFIKQELINNQEILRKIVLRSVRMCEREACRLPRFTGDLLNIGVLKDLLERLNMDNWSNQEDFSAFEGTALKLKDEFSRRITPPTQYLRSIILELEG